MKKIYILLVAVLSYVMGAGQVFNQQSFSKIAIDEGGDHIMALDNAGRLWIWGDNSDGQIGNNTVVDQTTPYNLMSEKTFIDIAACNNSSLAVDADGNLWVWGKDSYKLTLGSTTSDVLEPVQVMAGTTFKSIVAGYYTVSAVTSADEILIWGYNSDGQIGNGTSSFSGITVAFNLTTYGSGLTEPVTFTKVCHGYKQSFALDSEGNIWSFGQSTDYKLGVDLADADQTTPLKLDLGTTFTDISSGKYHSLAIDAAGNIWSWGVNNNGELGNGVADASTGYVAAQITTGTVFTSVEASMDQSYAIDNAGNVYAWGASDYGKLGISDMTEDAFVPTLADQFPSPIMQVEGSSYNAFALASNGQLYSLGSNSNALLGDGGDLYPAASLDVFTQVDISESITDVVAGDYTVIARVSDGDYVWGRNDYGLYGDGTVIARQSPYKITSLTSMDQISADNHALALDGSSQLWSWGDNSYGQVGTGESGTVEPSPVQITLNDGSVTTFKYISTGVAASYVIDTNDNLWTWGYGQSGNLGNGAYLNTNITPTQIMLDTDGDLIADVTTFKAVAGGNASAVIDMSGNIYTAGNNSYGTLGNGTVVSGQKQVEFIRITIQENATDVVFDQVAMGTYHALALDANGDVWAWGSDSHGQIGDNDGLTDNVSTPVKVMSGLNIVSIYAFGYVSFAIDNTGKLYGWGYATNLGVTEDVTVPTEIMAGTSFQKAGGNGYTVLLDTDGNLYITGSNSYGVLGTGDSWASEVYLVNDAYTPTAVEKIAETSSINVSPNPSYGFVNVNGLKGVNSTYELYNLSGQVVEKGLIQNGVINYDVTEGIYLLKITNQGSFKTFKIVVK